MATKNERSLAAMIRDLIVKSDMRIDDEKKILYLETIKEILSESEDGVRRPRTDDSYRYEGCEYRDFCKTEKQYMPSDPARGSDDDVDVCDAKRLAMAGKVCMFSAWKKDDDGNERCVLDIYYDHTLTYVLQPVTNAAGKLLGFSRVDNSPLCGQSRLRSNLRTWAEKGQDWWNSEHNYETDMEYLAISPRYRYDESMRDKWDKLCDKFYKVHPRQKVAEVAE